MENSVEIVIEKLLHVTKDIIPKVAKVGQFYCLFCICFLSLVSASSIHYSGLQ